MGDVNKTCALHLLHWLSEITNTNTLWLVTVFRSYFCSKNKTEEIAQCANVTISGHTKWKKTTTTKKTLTVTECSHIKQSCECHAP